jgi:response regulator RpfG family c-di-GMP phosphodiesterase
MSQHIHTEEEPDLVFAPEEDAPGQKGFSLPSWKILIIDDEPDIHEVTRASLAKFEFEGAGLNFLNAYSARQAKEILAAHSDIAVALVDVVMEDDDAGLNLIHYIRNELDNKLIRLVLRTGQPGQAPERQVIRTYDINDYKEKTELTAQKLDSTIYTSLRSYRDLVALDMNQRGLEHIVNASAHLFSLPSISEFLQGVLKQLMALLYLGDDAFYIGCECVAYENKKGVPKVIAATGRFADSIGKNPAEVLELRVYELLKEAQEDKKSILRDNEFIGYFEPHQGHEDIIYINSRHALNHKDLGLLELFLRNVSVAYENVMLHTEIEGSHRDMLYMLGDSIETRSQETGQHVRRVAEYCRLIGLGNGLTEREAEILEIASPLHDFGKIGIPDNILHKPGKLDEKEWEVMKSHAHMGFELLNKSDREILKAAAIIAGQHHEHWDGNGYPDGLKGTDIHLYARIVAVADVFDALGSKRSYKQAWSLEEILSFMQAGRGKQFDPDLIDWVMNNIDSMKQVRLAYPDIVHD